MRNPIGDLSSPSHSVLSENNVESFRSIEPDIEQSENDGACFEEVENLETDCEQSEDLESMYCESIIHKPLC